MTVTARAAAAATLWAYIQAIIGRGLTLIVFVVLARLLEPRDFGIFAFATVALTLSEVFVEQGLGHALVQRPDLDETHRSGAFWVTLGVGAVMAMVTMCVGAWIWWLGGQAEVGMLLMAITPVFLLMAASAVPAALLRRELNFRALARRTTWAHAVSGLCTIAAAAAGAGVWAFVVQQITYHGVGARVLWRESEWRPEGPNHWRFSGVLIGFSTRMVLIRLLDMLETRGVEMLIGARLGIGALGHYSLASRAHQAMTQILASPLWESSAVTFSRHQLVQAELRVAYARASEFAALFVAPPLLFAAVLADPLLPAIFGSKWEAAVAPFRWLALLAFVRSLTSTGGVLLHGTGEADKLLAIVVIRSLLAVALVAVSVGHGLEAAAICLLVAQAFVVPLSLKWASRSLGVSAISFQVLQLKPVAAATVGAFLAWWAALQLREWSPGWAAAVGMLVALSTYVVLVVLLMPRRVAMLMSGVDSRAADLFLVRVQIAIRLTDSFRLCILRMVLFLAALGPRPPPQPGAPILILPGDITSLHGSLGDQALIGGAVGYLRRSGYGAVRVIVAPGIVVPAFMEGLVLPLPVWGSWRGWWRTVQQLKGSAGLAIIGADVLDGHYSRFESVARLFVARAAAKLGIPVCICSFSMNAKPDPATLRAFARLPRSVSLMARDPVSMERLRRFTGHQACLTADLAFMLAPTTASTIDDELVAWLGRVRAGPIVGWNLSPHALRSLSRVQLAEAECACASVIKRLIDEKGARVVLMPHDFREHADDAGLLTRIHAQLGAPVRDRTLMLGGRYTAAEAKQACAHLDFLVSGRMHLMIAALAQGVPVAAVEYQGKFQGLLRLFGLDNTHTIEPHTLLSQDMLWNFVCDRLDRAAQTRVQVRQALPDVIALSTLNLAVLTKGKRA
jgi:O-antigen/teichoic acid export membrane protein/polysaccharide pyruvyl transferase WcaK-like protein